jgi:hypothetical protein
MLAAQLDAAGGESQPDVSLTPVEHSEWPHVPAEHARLLATVRTSLTQMLSQAVVQQ